MNYRADFHAPFSFIGTDIGEMNCGREEYKNAPESTFQLNFVEEFGFMIDLMTEEKNPAGDASFVFTANFSPESSEKYLKFIFRADKQMQAFVCEGDVCTELAAFYEKNDVMVSIREEGWDVIALIPKKIISDVYGGLEFQPGSCFKANFGIIGSHGSFQLSWMPLASFGEVALDRSIEAI